MAGIEDFDDIVDIVYKVANDQHSRGKNFTDILAKTLDKASPGVAGDFQVGKVFHKKQNELALLLFDQQVNIGVLRFISLLGLETSTRKCWQRSF